MDRRLTERLIGAIVLVAVGVVVIPELLSGGGEEPATSTLQLPAQPAETTLETRTIPLQPAAQASPAERPTTPPVETPRPAATVADAAPAAAQPAPAVPHRTEPVPAPRVASAAAPAVSGWAVQLGSFSERANAERLAAKLRDDGYPAFLSEASADGQTMHRVRVGPEQDRAQAEALAARLRRAGHAGQVLSHP